MFVNNILVLCVTFAVIKCDKSPKTDVNAKIADGVKYEINILPYMVSIKSKTQDDLCSCGGSIVNELWVLTAGHCMSHDGKIDSAQNFHVLVGSTKCYDIIDETSQSIDVAKLYLHEGYDVVDGASPARHYNDIGLVLLAKKIIFGPKVQPASLLTTDILKGKKPHEFFTEKCVASGWGIQDLEDTSDPYLYGVELSLMDIEKCESYHVSTTPQVLFNKSMIVCTIETDGRKDVCSGDSGGPLVCDGYQVGVISRGFGCGYVGVPKLYTEVDMYNDWIQRTIGGVKPEAKDLNSKGDVIQIIYYKLLVIAILEKCFLF